MRRVEVGGGYRVRVRAILGERAGHGARRVSLLAGGSDVDGLLAGGTVSATRVGQLAERV